MGLCQHFEIQAKGSRFVSVISRQMIDRKPAADADASNIKGWWSASLLHKKLNDPTMCTTTLSCSSAYACAQRKQQQLTKPSPSNDSGIDWHRFRHHAVFVLYRALLLDPLSLSLSSPQKNPDAGNRNPAIAQATAVISLIQAVVCVVCGTTSCSRGDMMPSVS